MNPLVLGIETATDVCSVGVVRGDTVLAVSSVRLPRSHATRLALLVQETLAHARLAAADLDCVAVSAGPGSYTGLRIGASLARGLCLATGARLVGVPTMAALATEAEIQVHAGEVLVVALPSRRGEATLFSPAGGDPEAVPFADAAAWLADRVPGGAGVAACGPAAEAFRDALAPRPVRVLAVAPSGARIARTGASLVAEGAEATFEPAYIGTFATPPVTQR
ncbi:MAG TPA: tRNA (adenosine(37)-N6)-threonylcarbamoyltransferase complex dimerization subunit type 1 TsaB [Rubricoccaceae bacterium]|jgi:tRNA threonylcarbamoyladenosine biosynthesis protein TsaB